ncbi:MAG TPA: class I SAM-dependent methyltransferase [Sphingomonas sp.]|nr:class I SAM-dependent methyltransferase [Sphingomonas sp.]
MTEVALSRFAAAYARHRAGEGRGHAGADLLALPHLTHGPLARQWAVRARSFDVFMRHLLRPEARRLGRALDLLDCGAGNGWLSYRVAREGHRATALDIRGDTIDGLGAAMPFLELVPGRITTLVAPFNAIPLDAASIDVTVFNAALHYSTDLGATLAEAARVTRPGGILAILDSPFYRRDAHGAAMAAEKRAGARARFGNDADSLMGLAFIQYLTRDRLAGASAIVWHRRRVLYPLWYELRPLVAVLRRQRPPSRFDLWWGRRP